MAAPAGTRTIQEQVEDISELVRVLEGHFGPETWLCHGTERDHPSGPAFGLAGECPVGWRGYTRNRNCTASAKALCVRDWMQSVNGTWSRLRIGIEVIDGYDVVVFTLSAN